MSKKGAHKSGNPNSKLRGQKAGASAPPTPAHRAGRTNLSQDYSRRLRELGLTRDRK